MAENIQAQLKKNLSLQVEIRNEEWKTYIPNLQNIRKLSDPNQGKIFIYRMGWVPDYPDPDTYMDLMMSTLQITTPLGKTKHLMH